MYNINHPLSSVVDNNKEFQKELNSNVTSLDNRRIYYKVIDHNFNVFSKDNQ